MAPGVFGDDIIMVLAMIHFLPCCSRANPADDTGRVEEGATSQAGNRFSKGTHLSFLQTRRFVVLLCVVFVSKYLMSLGAPNAYISVSHFRWLCRKLCSHVCRSGTSPVIVDKTARFPTIVGCFRSCWSLWRSCHSCYCFAGARTSGDYHVRDISNMNVEEA